MYANLPPLSRSLLRRCDIRYVAALLDYVCFGYIGAV
ncbi:MAG: hypothetical protein ACI8Z1_002440 [Candidatus Azotimanducaceae bacterium]|jgi:hypothetical protein